MKKILFVNMVEPECLGIRSRPVGLLSLYQIIKDEGQYEPQILELNTIYRNGEMMLNTLYETNISRIVKRILLEEPYIISIYSMCSNYHISLSVCEEIKRKNNQIKIILAGPHAAAVAFETIVEFSFVDFVAMGEGENTVCDIIHAIDKEDYNTLISTEGIALSYDGHVYINPVKEKYCDVNELPMLNYLILDEQYYEDQVYPIEIGRGCPFKCAFCSTSLFWGRKFRIKNVKRVISEIKYYYSKGVRQFDFMHDMLTYRREYILELCKEIYEWETSISWHGYARLDRIDEEMIREMVRAGCNHLFFGIETGSASMQKTINKGLILHNVEFLLHSLSKYQLNTTFSFIIGFPEESERDLVDTLELIHKIKHFEVNNVENAVEFNIQVTPAIFIPNTKMTNESMRKLVFNEYDRLGLGLPTYKKGFISPKVLQMILEHKVIFSHHYILENNNNPKFNLLHQFIMFIYKFIYTSESNLIDKILKKNGNDFMIFYKKMYEIFYSQLSDLMYEVFTIKDPNIDDIKKRFICMLNLLMV